MRSDDDIPGPWWSIFDFLAQDEWWHPRELAAPIRVATMEPSHQRNLLRFLRRSAPRLPVAHTKRSIELLFGVFAPRGECARDNLERGIEVEFSDILDDPAAWLERQPLVTRLRDLVAVRDLIGAGAEWWESCSRCGHDAHGDYCGVIDDNGFTIPTDGPPVDPCPCNQGA